MYRYKLEILIAFLLIASVTALVLNNSCPRTFVFKPDNSWRVIGVDDRSEGGHSVANVDVTGDSFQLRYRTQKGQSATYAVMSISTEEKEQFDFLWMEEIQITARCTEDGDAGGYFYFQLRTEQDGITSEADPASLKCNQTVIQPSRDFSVISLRRDQFSIPGWWIQRYELPYVDRKPSFENVEAIEFTSIAETSTGKLEVQSIRFVGFWVSPALLAQSLLGVWMLSFLGVLLARVFSLRKNLKLQQEKESALVALNESLAIQSKELADKASADPLTGLLNRRGMRDFIFENIVDFQGVKTDNGVRENGPNYSLIIFDLDRFKSINDTLGHAVGDQILCDVATTLKNRIGCDAAVSRWGGEEFLIVCLDQTAEDSEKLAESLREEFESSGLNYTASFGVCCSQIDQEFAGVLEAADQAMYFAKNNGRNRVVRFSEELLTVTNQNSARANDEGGSSRLAKTVTTE